MMSFFAFFLFDSQCQRRSLKCEYPSESRRGMRKKKAPSGSGEGKG